MKKYLFYPGCSVSKSARSYYDSIMAIRDTLDITFEEIKDWNCCGATEYGSVHRLGAYALQGRNLALAERQANGARTVTAPCSACYLNLSRAEHAFRNDAQLADNINAALAAGNLHYTPGALDVRHLLDVVFNDVGVDEIQRKVVRPLKGLRVAAYYGCMIVRPDPDQRFGSYEYPNVLERLLKALGAEVIDFPLKAHCCSGHMTQISAKVAYELIRRLVHGAAEYRADLMVTVCPMCQLNLDAYQPDMNRFFNTSYHMPVLYFTQLMGLAFGKSPQELGIGREFVDARTALSRIGFVVPLADGAAQLPAAQRPRGEESLPMPLMPGCERIRNKGKADD